MTEPVEKKLRRVVKYAYENSPFFNRKLRKAKIKPEGVKTLDDFRRIPYTSKSELVDDQRAKPPFGDFLAVPRDRLRQVFLHPGPIYAPYTEKDFDTIGDICAKSCRMCGVKGSDVVQITFTYHFMAGAHVVHMGAKKLNCAIVPAGTGESRIQAEVMKLLKTTVFLGTPSFLGRIGDVAKEMGFDLRKDLSLRIGIFAAEPLPEALRKELESSFGLEAYNFYGLAEAPAISQECNMHTGMHINDEYYFVELVDPDTGEVLKPKEQGEIVVTPLWREAMPLLRYRSGDISSYDDGSCPCGRSAARLPLIVGRLGTTVKVKGVFVHPRQAEGVVSKHPNLGRFQIVVDRPERLDLMTVKVECVKAVKDPAALTKTLRREFKEVLRLDTDVKLVSKGEIPPDAKPLEDRRKYV